MLDCAIIYILLLFTKCNYACEVFQITNKIVLHFHRGAQVKCVKMPLRAADITSEGDWLLITGLEASVPSSRFLHVNLFDFGTYLCHFFMAC